MSAFFFHYNKPASAKKGHPVLTVHYKGVCHMVRHIACYVPVQTRERKTQPHVVMAGRGIVEFQGDGAIISSNQT